MTQAADSVITKARFESGKTFQEYLDSGIRNLDLFKENYDELEISESQVAALRALAAKDGGVDHMVVIGEDWCPDVYRGLGVAQKIADAAGIELRMFERDQDNNDMMQPYLKNGEFESIPVYVFYDKDHNELGHFVERPAKANDEMHLLQGVIKQVSPEALEKELGHEPSEDEIKTARAEARKGYLEWQKGDVWASWRVAAVDEVIALLS